jgi:TolA-binding protein
MLAALLASSTLAGCGAFGRGGSPDNEPTLRTLAGRSIAVQTDGAFPQVSEAQAIEAYQRFLAIAPTAGQRGEAMRRIGDLEMERAESRAAGATGVAGADAPDFKVAIARYQEYLKTNPNDAGNDRVLYQLARAHEQGGDLETALKTLDRLVADFPATAHRDEAQFRRGELLFTARRYAESEKAFSVVLAVGPANGFHDRSLYMHGWSLYKQARLEEALASFFAVLDLKVGDRPGEGGLETLHGLSRADRELVEDTFRVVSISLENLKGAATIAAFVDSPTRKGYEFRVYEQLGELYIRQERTKDAADTFGAFGRRNPLHAQAPVLQARVIDIYEKTGFGAQALLAKKEYVGRYGRDSEFRRANPEGWEKAQPLVRTTLVELARHHHASAQKTKAKADAQEAIVWYRELIASFPADAEAPKSHFLLAELLYDEGRFAEASDEYEKTAYGYPRHERSADAGYAALLARGEQHKRAAAAEKATLQRAAVASAVRFADAFGSDARTGPVLADAAEKLYALGDAPAAAALAQRVVDLGPAAADAQRKVAWTVLAHTAFESQAFDRSERAYAEALRLTGEREPGRNDLVERQAAAVYKQGEQAREAGKGREAVAAFARVAAVAPQSAIRATAQYDAAASLLTLKDWEGAAATLEDFRKRYPNHPLQAEVGGKLAVAYLEKKQWPQAGAEYERIAAASKDPAVMRDAQWQAAELYEKGQARAAAARAYEAYLRQHPQPLEPAVEARWRLAAIARQDRDAAREAALMKDILQADQAGGAARTYRTRFLGATAALAVAEPTAEQYRRVALVEPLQQQLRLKKARMEDALKAYAVAADYGVADVTTAATYRIATLYRDFGKALLSSERPKRLSRVEREQYDVLLEEQAYPFEEKAIELHEVNARRATQGVYDQWVKDSFAALRELRPVRYGKSEVTEGAIDAIR